MCARATDMIGEMATAAANKLTVPQLLLGMRAHPTYNEAVGERWRSLKAAASTRFPDRLRASLRADSNQENRMSGGISLWQSSVHLTY